MTKFDMGFLKTNLTVPKEKIVIFNHLFHQESGNSGDRQQKKIVKISQMLTRTLTKQTKWKMLTNFEMIWNR